ncbi:MAG: tetratricopeptide repeat protein [Sandaracinaceae bacterium]|nr:tetratricopeptide repeat protein [Sandaracinaceae bacterium]
MSACRALVAFACALALWAATGAARAQDDTPPEAVEFYRQAREHYSAGRYRDAADALERALVLDPDSPTLMFNLARVYELLGELDRALVMYERYQRILPQQQAQEQEHAEATIRRLQGARESTQGARATPPPAPQEVEALRQLPGLVLVRESGVADDAFWTLFLGGLAVLAAGGGIGVFALVTRASADDFVLGQDGDPAARRGLYADATLFAAVGDAALGVGAVAVVAAGLLYFLREHTVERAPVRAVERETALRLEPDLALGPDVAVAGLRGTF